MDKILRQLDPKVVRPAVIEAFKKAGEIGVPEIRQRAPKFSGRLARGARLKMQGAMGDRIPKWARIGTKAKHGHLVEKGTRPHFPDIRADTKSGRRMRRWVRKKMTLQPGRNQRERIANTAFVLARAMRRRGTRGQPFMAPTFRAVRGRVQSVMDTMRDRLESEWKRVG